MKKKLIHKSPITNSPVNNSNRLIKSENEFKIYTKFNLIIPYPEECHIYSFVSS